MRNLIFIFMIFLVGCTPKSNTYLIPAKANRVIATTNTQIGVKKVIVPDYLLSDKILIKEGNQIKELNAKFATSIDKLLTSNAIKELKSLLNDPNVVLYPWDAKRKRGYIIEIVIDDYLYYERGVHLSGSYRIKSANGEIVSSKNFNLMQKSQKDADSIVDALGSIFDRLVKEIAQNIAI